MVALEPTCDGAHVRSAPSIHQYFTISNRTAKKIFLIFQVFKARRGPTFPRNNVQQMIRIGYANSADSANGTREAVCLPGIARALRVPEQSLQHPRCPLAGCSRWSSNKQDSWQWPARCARVRELLPTRSAGCSTTFMANNGHAAKSTRERSGYQHVNTLSNPYRWHRGYRQGFQAGSRRNACDLVRE